MTSGCTKVFQPISDVPSCLSPARSAGGQIRHPRRPRIFPQILGARATTLGLAGVSVAVALLGRIHRSYRAHHGHLRAER